MPAARRELPVLAFPTSQAWEQWLTAEHASSPGIWLKFAKKASGVASVTHDEALDVAICFGWIDGQTARFDERYFLQHFTPRRKRSKWSQVNRDKALRLIGGGRMAPAGLDEVQRAQADGRWDAAYAPPSQITVPDDLQQALDRDAAARRFFGQLDSQNRYAILYRVHDAKRPETRARRIEKFVAMLAAGEKPHP
jgi:uncharacterized protein YdeI (YjbR/CyaY-like superfamily)